MSNWHILPTNDLKAHEELSTCDCIPTVEIIKGVGDLLIIHNAYDGRK